MALSPAKRAFMKFWYPYVGMLNSAFPSIKIEGKHLVVSPSVYKPLENEHAAARYCRPGDRVLDLGCGSGVFALFTAPKASEVVAVDINSNAVENTIENCRRHGLTNVTVHRSDMFSNVEGKFDIVLANPPFVSLEFESDEQQFATSVRFLPTLFGQVSDYLTDGGRLLILFPLWYRTRLEKLAAAHGLELLEAKRTPRKSPRLGMLSLAYMQVGWRSAFYLFGVAA
ncbi:methyltransferase [Mycobacterium sp. 23]|uniref:methyltransferase n=1 Tax=Mycobacterium sp. 23 TaxID=3400424 RepID=UPI003AAA7077